MEQFETVSASGQFFLVTDTTTGQILDVDQNIEQVTGWTFDDLIGRPWLSFVHFGEQAAVLDAGESLIARRRGRFAVRLRHADGSWVVYQVVLTLGHSGDVAYVWVRDARRAMAEQADLWQFQKMIQLASDIFVVTDVAGNIITVNDAVEPIHGIARHDMIGMNLTDLIPSEGVAVLEEIVTRAAAGEDVIDFEIPSFDRDGNVLIMEGRTTLDPETQRFYTVQREITDRVHRERELEIGHRFFELSRSHLALVDTDGTVLRANPSLARFLGRPEAQLVGRSLPTVLGQDERTELADLIAETARTGENRTQDTTVDAGGLRRLVNCTLTCSNDGKAVYYSARDVTEERRLAEELLDRATHDQLTRLATRQVFEAELEQILSTGNAVGVMMTDLDEFKRINDGMGHSAGDELLRQVGNRILEAARAEDLVARFGGDEFVVLLRGLTSTDEAMLAAERIREAVARPYQLVDRPLHVSMSLGVAVGSSPTHSGAGLLRQADAAAYEAKRAGRDTVRLFDSTIGAGIEHERTVERLLRSAMASGSLDIDVQGIFAIDGSLKGIEALVRLPDENGRRLAPGHFLDVARRLGLMVSVGELVVDRTLSALSGWLRANPTMTVSVNADPAELVMPDFARVFAASLERNAVEPRQVVVEATETGILEPDGQASATLAELQEFGVGVAIDDFGAGASSLGYLRDLVVDQLKIDRSFIQGLDCQVTRAITVSVVGLANELGVPVVAEGVEQREMIQGLAEMGCSMVQGFALHRPQPVDLFLSSPISSGPISHLH